MPSLADSVPMPRCSAGGADLLNQATAMLARREHSRAEMARKLLRRLDDGQTPADVEAVLDELQRRGLLSEERFAASLVRTRSPRLGDARLKYELRTRGVPAAVAAAALAGLRGEAGSELARARAVWSRRFGVAPRSTQERARQARFLQARGFGAEVIRMVLRGLPADDGA
jgi:regulatory protein